MFYSLGPLNESHSILLNFERKEDIQGLSLNQIQRAEPNDMRRQIVFMGVSIAILIMSVQAFPQGQESVPAPEGWGQCPRCQNNKDRIDANAKYKVEGHAFNAHDLSGVWGFGGAAGAFRDAPPL